MIEQQKETSFCSLSSSFSISRKHRPVWYRDFFIAFFLAKPQKVGWPTPNGSCVQYNNQRPAGTQSDQPANGGAEEDKEDTLRKLADRVVSEELPVLCTRQKRSVRNNERRQRTSRHGRLPLPCQGHVGRNYDFRLWRRKIVWKELYGCNEADIDRQGGVCKVSVGTFWDLSLLNNIQCCIIALVLAESDQGAPGYRWVLWTSTRRGEDGGWQGYKRELSAWRTNQKIRLGHRQVTLCPFVTVEWVTANGQR